MMRYMDKKRQSVCWKKEMLRKKSKKKKKYNVYIFTAQTKMQKILNCSHK